MEFNADESKKIQLLARYLDEKITYRFSDVNYAIRCIIQDMNKSIEEVTASAKKNKKRMQIKVAKYITALYAA